MVASAKNHTGKKAGGSDDFTAERLIHIADLQISTA
jgi:hypothetical protein